MCWLRNAGEALNMEIHLSELCTDNLYQDKNIRMSDIRMVFMIYPLGDICSRYVIFYPPVHDRPLCFSRKERKREGELYTYKQIHKI